MEHELREYQLALEANLAASRDEYAAKAEKRRAYCRLMAAKEELRAKEKELLEDTSFGAVLA